MKGEDCAYSHSLYPHVCFLAPELSFKSKGGGWRDVLQRQCIPTGLKGAERMLHACAAEVCLSAGYRRKGHGVNLLLTEVPVHVTEWRQGDPL